jgi:hypothetical protein
VQVESAQFALRQLALARAEKILRVMLGQLAAGNDSFQHMVVRFESYVHRHDFEAALKPETADLLQRDISSRPMNSCRRLLLLSTPGAFGYLRICL